MLLLSAISCNPTTNNGEKNMRKQSVSPTEKNEGYPEISFESQEHDFGKVYEGETVGWYFKYRNTGNAPLIITKANASCGCTVPEFRKEPLAPGKEGFIKVIFDTSGRSDKQTKTITVESNAARSPIILRIKAEIISNQNNKPN